jgi:hypothetical protein
MIQIVAEESGDIASLDEAGEGVLVCEYMHFVICNVSSFYINELIQNQV